LWAWFAFGAVLLGLVAIDLVLHRGGRGQSRAAAITWTAMWIGLGLGFVFVAAPRACPPGVSVRLLAAVEGVTDARDSGGLRPGRGVGFLALLLGGRGRGRLLGRGLLRSTRRTHEE
jgi:hypothetical protein